MAGDEYLLDTADAEAGEGFDARVSRDQDGCTTRYSIWVTPGEGTTFTGSNVGSPTF